MREYIKSITSVKIKDFAYVTVDDNGLVIGYETSTAQDKIDHATLEDFLLTHNNVIGLYSANQIYITKHHDVISNCTNETTSGNNFCYTKNQNYSFLGHNIRKYSHLLIVDITDDVTNFNFKNYGRMLLALGEFDELFKSRRATRVYKKYNEYFIFY